MLKITYATTDDIKYLCSSINDPLTVDECISKIRDKKCYILHLDSQPIGLMRYNLFWDFIPFLTMIYLDEPYRKKGFGAKALKFWEDEMRSLGHPFVMLSTRIDESAQGFYRKFGYIDMGSLVMENTPYKQPLEVFLGKNL